jgi:acetylornithine/succinyldiaminopimelate/putrescine aminotransferase
MGARASYFDNTAVTNILPTEAARTSGVYPKRTLAIVRGAGARVWDAEGNEYIDCVAGQGSANLGHCHPLVVEAIREQAGRLITCPEIFYNDLRAALLNRLALVAPRGLDRAFLCNSGTEAVEAAIKFARVATAGRASLPRATASTAARWAACPRPGRTSTAGHSRRSCRASPMCRSTTWRPSNRH